MALPAKTNEDKVHSLDASGKPKSHKSSIRRTLNPSNVNLRTEYIHCWRKDLSNITGLPTTMKICDTLHHPHYTRFVIMNQEEYDKIRWSKSMEINEPPKWQR